MLDKDDWIAVKAAVNAVERGYANKVENQKWKVYAVPGNCIRIDIKHKEQH